MTEAERFAAGVDGDGDGSPAVAADDDTGTARLVELAHLLRAIGSADGDGPDRLDPEFREALRARLLDAARRSDL